MRTRYDTSFRILPLNSQELDRVFCFCFFSILFSMLAKALGTCVNDHTLFHSQVALSLFSACWSQALHEITQPLNMTAPGDVPELMRQQEFVNQMPLEDFFFLEDESPSLERLAESFHLHSFALALPPPPFCSFLLLPRRSYGEWLWVTTELPSSSSFLL